MKTSTIAIIVFVLAISYFARVQPAAADSSSSQALTVKNSNSATAHIDDAVAIDSTLNTMPPLTATYRIRFDATWSQATHPHGSFPGNPHFSRMIGGIHNDYVTFWQLGGMASTGIENMAEVGGVTDLQNEVNAAITAMPPTALAIVGGELGHNIGTSPGSATITSFSVTQDFPLVTLVSMLAPSPDWFVGVSGLPLFESGDWVPSKTIQLYPYDAGTEEGTGYSLANPDTIPQETITNISGVSPFSSNDVGTFTFTRIDFLDLGMHKSVEPETNVAPQDLITYSLAISNSGDTDAAGTIVTDTLPVSTTFAGWVQQPVGANAAGDQITWTGNVTAGEAITFAYAATYTGIASGETFTSTAEYAHASGNGQSEVGFMVQTSAQKVYLPLILKVH